MRSKRKKKNEGAGVAENAAETAEGQDPAALREEGDPNEDSSSPELQEETATTTAEAEVDPVAALQARVEELEDRLLRARADAQNAAKRAAAECADAVRYGNTQLMKSLLSVLDDFNRSLEALEKEQAPKSVIEGERLIYENLLKALQAAGLHEIDALHQPFDPSRHEAMLQQPSADHPTGTVLQEVAKGYRLHDRVIRPSKVIVSKAVEEGSKGPGDT
ncbi:MAG: nucleotide exchange factor GrpE [Phycisphaerales bacterium]|nr:MAG: nucleotide exchange factor GrpE [Phycisphaerales bacterium]